MSRRNLATALSVVLTALMMPTVHASDRGYETNAAPPLLIPQETAYPLGVNSQPPAPINPIYTPVSKPATTVSMQGPTGTPPSPIDANMAPQSGGQMGVPPQQGYVRLGAPMYPTPRPNIPIWTGSTVITNQAFAPQEMLYPHTYRAIYPPFYHRVKGGWIVTPLGVRSHEQWELQGTQVEVKYRSSYPGLLSGAFWHPHLSPIDDCRWR